MLRHTKCSTSVDVIAASAMNVAISHKMAIGLYVLTSLNWGKKIDMMEEPSPHTDNTIHSAGEKFSKQPSLTDV